MTAVICSGVRAISTKRRPSLPIASNATTLFGPAVTCGFVGASGYAGSTTSSARITCQRTRLSRTPPVTASSVAAATCPTSGVTGLAGRPISFDTRIGVPSAIPNWTPARATNPPATAPPMATERPSCFGLRSTATALRSAGRPSPCFARALVAQGDRDPARRRPQRPGDQRG